NVKASRVIKIDDNLLNFAGDHVAGTKRLHLNETTAILDRDVRRNILDPGDKCCLESRFGFGLKFIADRLRNKFTQNIFYLFINALQFQEVFHQASVHLHPLVHSLGDA
ncbi:4590_t:CDS:1, partial [Acaulospora colombiana]